MFDFERPNIEVAEISDDGKYGRFVVEPLERGYGITLGNSLRRCNRNHHELKESCYQEHEFHKRAENSLYRV